MTSINELQRKYAELFGSDPASTHKKFLERKIAYRVQELARGGFSPELLSQINGMIKSYDPINHLSIKAKSRTVTGRDPRLPMPGSLITKNYKGQKIEVKVLEKGFECQDVIYKNLSAVAKIVTGDHWNGYMFFGLTKNGN